MGSKRYDDELRISKKVQFIVQRHFTLSTDEDPEPVSLWDDLESAMADYKEQVRLYRRYGLEEVKGGRVVPKRGCNPLDVRARAVFVNLDDSLTVLTLQGICGASRKGKRT